ncbi:MAG: HAD-IA family hydrolase [Pseudomonadota bacterium]
MFDCDGTLVDSQHAIVCAMNAAFAVEGLGAPDPAEIRRGIGLPLLDCVRRLAPALAPPRHARLAEAYKETIFGLGRDHHERLFDGAREALSRLEAEGVLLGIATGKSRRGLLAVLDRVGLAHRFATLQTGDDGPGKPHPAMLRRALVDTGTAPDAAVMIGDTTFDMAMARSSGVYALGVGWGYHPADELERAGAQALIASFAELPGAVARLARRKPCD